MTRRRLPPAVPTVRRVPVGLELLDGPLDDPATLRGNLRDLKRTNRWLGGTRLSSRAVAALLGQADEASILDVGTGAADIPLALLRAAGGSGRRWQVTAVDERPEIIEAAQAVSPELSATRDLVFGVADGRSLPYNDDQFDVCHASLVLHHLEPVDAVSLIGELGRVARVGVVVNDLVRARLTHAGAWLLAHLLTANRYTRHDAPLSARRAYSRAELVALLDAAELRVVAEARGLAGHRWAFAAVSR